MSEIDWRHLKPVESTTSRLEYILRKQIIYCMKICKSISLVSKLDYLSGHGRSIMDSADIKGLFWNPEILTISEIKQLK